MKRKYFNPINKTDVLEIALQKLQSIQTHDDETSQLLNDYNSKMIKDSDHMKMLKNKMEIIRQNYHFLDDLFDLFPIKPDIR